MVIYFLLQAQNQNYNTHYPYQLICLAQGFKKLNIDFYSNFDYWRDSNSSFLFNYNADVNPEDCDIVIFQSTYNWKRDGVFFPREIRSQKNKKFRTIYIDTADGLFTSSFLPEFRDVDIILKQMNRNLKYPSNCKAPWVFGLSDYLIGYFERPPHWKKRDSRILVNYRNIHRLRQLANQKFISKLSTKYHIDKNKNEKDHSYVALDDNPTAFSVDQLNFIQSGKRHHPEYLDRIQNSKFCACFGGEFAPPPFITNNKPLYDLAKYFFATSAEGRLLNLMKFLRLQVNRTNNVFQWDSWRLWESWAGGSIPLHIDFDRYGVNFRDAPANWKHYIGINFDNIERDVERILSLDDDELETISNAGREWAIEKYSPIATAKRLLKIIED